MNKIKPAHIIIGVGVALVAVFAIPQLTADQPGMISTSGDVITETIGVVEADSSVTYLVALQEGSDAEHESSHIFEALTGLAGVGKASLDTQTLELTVTYDSSVIGDSIIRDQIVTTGYLVPTASDGTPTEVAEDGSVQRISVTDDGIQFDPFIIKASSGIPTEIEFSPGQECRVSISFPDLGIEQDLRQGGTVTLPALEPGQYDIICSGGGVDGSVIVE